MEPTTGIEPVNLILTKDVLYLLSYVGRELFSEGNDSPPFPFQVNLNKGIFAPLKQVVLNYSHKISVPMNRIAIVKYCRISKLWSGKRDSNPRPSAWKADALAN